MALLQRNSTVPLFLLATAKLFPGATRFLFGNEQFTPHFSHQFLELQILDFVLCSASGCVGSRLSLLLHLSFQHRVNLLVPLQLCSGFEEPPLEFALGTGAKPLQLDNSMEKIGPGGREVGNLSRELRSYRVALGLICVFL
jgi:hypothetical protein